eukprot:g6628.t1
MSGQGAENEFETKRLAFEKTFNSIVKKVSTEWISPSEVKKLNEQLVSAEKDVEKQKEEVTHLEELFSTMIRTINETKTEFLKKGKTQIAQRLENTIKTQSKTIEKGSRASGS